MHDRDFTIGFSTSKRWSFLSWIIRLFTRSEVSHCYGSFKVLGVRYVLGMDGHGLDWRPLTRFEAANRLLYLFKPIDGDLARVLPLDAHLAWMIRTYGGAPYDKGSFFVQGFEILFRWLGLATVTRRLIAWAKWRFAKSEAAVCSELYLRLLQHADYQCVRDLDPEMTDAQELLNVMLKHPEQFERIM